MNYIENFLLWKDNEFFDQKTRDYLSKLDMDKDAKAIEDRFYKELEFGTAGLRGVMGVGTNRMNKYTVGKATAGYAEYLSDTYSSEECLERGVVIAYDTRNNSSHFAKVAARIFTSYGIKVAIFKFATPIPILSFAIRNNYALGGIVITASHNPKEYNGYKVYDETGCQLGVDESNKVTEYINDIESYEDIDFDGDEELIHEIDLLNEYTNTISRQSIFHDNVAKSNLKVVFTPLHGTGLIPVYKALKENGFSNVHVVEEQKKPDGNFSTVPSPNPGDKNALKMGIEKALELGYDIVIGTDPDSDRLGVAVKVNNDFKLLTGNQIGALLIDFIINNKDLSNFRNPVIIKSIVTSDLGKVIADRKGIPTLQTLTGFKFIGERMNEFVQAKREGNRNKNYDFLFGYEESYGFLAGSHARDKDAVFSALLVCEMAAKLKSEGKTLNDRLNELYSDFGYYYDVQDNLTLKGKENADKISGYMDKLRNSESPFEGTKKVIDYKKGMMAEEGFGYLPSSNVLMYILNDDSWIAVRPSGTEPQIKFYYSIKGATEAEATSRQIKLKESLKVFLNLDNY